MCIICDGGTHDDVMFAIDSKVTTYGWTIQPVGGEGGSRPGWAYTIGLADRFDHPELLVVSCWPGSAVGLLRHLGERIERGERFHDAAIIETEPGPYPVVDVHRKQLEAGVTAVWHDYYASLGRTDLSDRVLQVKAPLVCAKHPLDTWSLDRPAPILNLGNRAPNRAQRRAKERRSRS